jgi:hypothetical protein
VTPGVFLIAVLTLANPPPHPIRCDRLEQATAEEFVCEASTTRVALDANHGVYMPEMNDNLASCKDNAEKALVLERAAFIKLHRNLIRKLRPGFRMQKASDEDWRNLMYAKPAMFEANSAKPMAARTSN